MNLGHRPAPPSQAPSRLGLRQRQRIVLALVLLVGAVLLGLGLSPTEPTADAGPAKPLALVSPPVLTMAPVPEEDSDDGWVLRTAPGNCLQFTAPLRRRIGADLHMG